MSGPNLPASIARRMIERGSQAASRWAASALDLVESSRRLRGNLLAHGVIERVPDLDHIAAPLAAAVDGSRIVQPMAAGDLCIAAGVRVGPGGDDGDCEVFVEAAPRHQGNDDAMAALMHSTEIRLAAGAPGDLLLLDGSLVSAFLGISKGLIRASSLPNGPLRSAVNDIVGRRLREETMFVLTERRFVAMPKYAVVNEFRELVDEEFKAMDGRTIATAALEPGEMTLLAAHGMNNDDRGRSGGTIGGSFGFSKAEKGEFERILDASCSLYYRPHAWTSAFRLVLTDRGSADGEWLQGVLRLIRDSTRSAGIKEPVPLYLADLFAKEVSIGASAVTAMAASSAVASPEARMLIAMGYRT